VGVTIVIFDSGEFIDDKLGKAKTVYGVMLRQCENGGLPAFYLRQKVERPPRIGGY